MKKIWPIFKLKKKIFFKVNLLKIIKMLNKITIKKIMIIISHLKTVKAMKITMIIYLMQFISKKNKIKTKLYSKTFVNK